MWKDIEGYEGLYQVSPDGRVKTLTKYLKGRHATVEFKEKELKMHRDKGGYLFVTLSKNSKKRKGFVHRLVAKCFIPNPESKPDVNHINGIKSDNHVDNLEWATKRENVKHSFTTLGRQALKGGKHPNAKTVKAIQADGLELLFLSHADASRYYSIPHSSVRKSINTQKPNTKGKVQFVTNQLNPQA